MPISVMPGDTRQWVTAIATGTLTFAELTEFILTKQSGHHQHFFRRTNITSPNWDESPMAGFLARPRRCANLSSQTRGGFIRVPSHGDSCPLPGLPRPHRFCSACVAMGKVPLAKEMAHRARRCVMADLWLEPIPPALRDLAVAGLDAGNVIGFLFLPA